MDNGKRRQVTHEMKQLEHAFKIFSSKYGGMQPNSNEKIPLATNSDLNKWCMDAGIVGPYLTSGDVDIAFAQVKMRGSKYLTLEDMPKLLDSLAGKYAVAQRCDASMARNMLVDKLGASSFKLHGTTNTAGADRTGRLTEHAHYTGTQGHKGTVQHFENYRQEARKARLE